MNKPFSKRITTIILTALFLIVVGLAYGFLALSQEEGLSWDTVVKHKQPIIYEELKTEMDTSDWLTYRNEKYGFELKYPKEWFDLGSMEFSPEELAIYEHFPLSVQYFASENVEAPLQLKNNNSVWLSVDILRNERSLGIQKFVDKTPGRPTTAVVKITQQKSVLINGINGIIQQEEVLESDGESTGPVQTFYIPLTKNKVLHYSLFSFSNSQQTTERNREILKKIALSTKLLDN